MYNDRVIKMEKKKGDKWPGNITEAADLRDTQGWFLGFAVKNRIYTHPPPLSSCLLYSSTSLFPHLNAELLLLFPVYSAQVLPTKESPLHQWFSNSGLTSPSLH